MADPMRTHGMFSWQELYAGNRDAMKRFYADVLGWRFDDMPMPDGAYPIIKAGDSGIGGMVSGAGGIKGWMPYVTVDDVEAAIAKATAAGGKVVSPAMNVPPVGRMATLADPEGAVFAVIKYAAQSS
ncbi:MAG: VOC family protein [Alphaproteobacteria bacterium]|nr:VOC family protein [Alphaproteobacteria bacterium]